MVYYLNTFENFDNYKNIFIINYLNVYTSIPIPITIYSEILSLYGICHITDEHNNIHLPISLVKKKMVYQMDYQNINQII